MDCSKVIQTLSFPYNPFKISKLDKYNYNYYRIYRRIDVKKYRYFIISIQPPLKSAKGGKSAKYIKPLYKYSIMIYVIYPYNCNLIKIGRWSGDLQDLYRRYFTYYGHLKIHYYDILNKYNVIYEKAILKKLKTYNIQGELFKKEAFDTYLTICNNTCNINAKIYDKMFIKELKQAYIKRVFYKKDYKEMNNTVIIEVERSFNTVTATEMKCSKCKGNKNEDNFEYKGKLYKTCNRCRKSKDATYNVIGVCGKFNLKELQECLKKNGFEIDLYDNTLKDMPEDGYNKFLTDYKSLNIDMDIQTNEFITQYK